MLFSIQYSVYRFLHARLVDTLTWMPFYPSHLYRYTPCCRISKTHCSRWVATQIHPELWVYDILLYIINVFVLKEMVTLCALWLDIYYMFSYTPCLHRLTIALSSCLTPSCINRCNINSLGDNMIIQVPWDVILQYYNYILCFRCSNKPSLFEPLGCLSLVHSIHCYLYFLSEKFIVFSWPAADLHKDPICELKFNLLSISIPRRSTDSSEVMSKPPIFREWRSLCLPHLFIIIAWNLSGLADSPLSLNHWIATSE